MQERTAGLDWPARNTVLVVDARTAGAGAT